MTILSTGHEPAPAVVPAYVTADDLAASWQISRRRVYDLVRFDGLPAIRLGRTVRFDPAAVAIWLESQASAR